MLLLLLLLLLLVHLAPAFGRPAAMIFFSLSILSPFLFVMCVTQGEEEIIDCRKEGKRRRFAIEQHNFANKFPSHESKVVGSPCSKAFTSEGKGTL